MLLPDINDEITNEQSDEENRVAIPREYQDYLNRLEQDYLSACATFTLIRNFLLTLTANSANISLCLLAIDFGLGSMSASLLGFALGSIPAMIDIGESGIDLASDQKIRDISRLVFGFSKLIASGGISWNATKENRQLMEYSKESIQAFEVEIKNYEIKVQPTDGLSLTFQFQIVLGTSLGVTLLSILINKLFRR